MRNTVSVAKRACLVLSVWALVGLAPAAMAQSEFAQERARHDTSVGYVFPERFAAPAPPPEIFLHVAYESEVGELGAYLTPDPGHGERYPAIIWLHGGRTSSLFDMWSPPPAGEDDQTAAGLREAGIVMMLPSLRGGNANPGQIEGLFGEVDDVLAAADFLETVPWVDPARIYLGGHSTGGTLVLLIAAASDRFRAAVAFGPVADGTRYGDWYLPVDFRRKPRWERRLRAPVNWLGSVATPLYVIEAASGNSADLRELERRSRNPLISFIEVRDVTHTGILAPGVEVVARAILADDPDDSAFPLDRAAIRALGQAGD